MLRPGPGGAGRNRRIKTTRKCALRPDSCRSSPPMEGNSVSSGAGRHAPVPAWTRRCPLRPPCKQHVQRGTHGSDESEVDADSHSLRQARSDQQSDGPLVGARPRFLPSSSCSPARHHPRPPPHGTSSEIRDPTLAQERSEGNPADGRRGFLHATTDRPRVQWFIECFA